MAIFAVIKIKQTTMSISKSFATFLVTLLVSAFTVFLSIPKKTGKFRAKSSKVTKTPTTSSEDLFI